VKKILPYREFLENLQINLSRDILDLKESLSVDDQLVLSSVGDRDLDIFTTLNLTQEDTPIDDLSILLDSPIFVNSLISIGLKKSQLQNTEDYQTFLKNPIRFSFIFRMESNDLEEPQYILYQSYNGVIEKWNPVKIRKVENGVKKFYDRLTSKTIELSLGDDNWIYSTSNAREWELQNLDTQTDEFKKVLLSDDINQLIKSKNLSVEII